MTAEPDTLEQSAAAFRHDALTILLHWTLALMIVLSYAASLLREVAPRGPSRDMMLMLHTSFGVLVVAGAVLRLAWRISRSARPPLADHVVNGPARLAHLALYAGMIGVPIMGVMLTWAKGRGISVFGLAELMPPIAANRPLAKVLEEVHEVAAHAMMALIGFHAAAALFHHYMLRDGVLASMMPRLR